MHIATINGKKAMNLKESKEEFIGGFGGWERRNDVIMLQSQNVKEIIKKCYKCFLK